MLLYTIEILRLFFNAITFYCRLFYINEGKCKQFIHMCIHMYVYICIHMHVYICMYNGLVYYCHLRRIEISIDPFTFTCNMLQSQIRPKGYAKLYTFVSFKTNVSPWRPNCYTISVYITAD